MLGRHALRPDCATSLVAPELVLGTLREGLRIFHTLNTPFQRAALMMFMISEVHPFADGNGRLARAMMNAELSAAEEFRILIVTSYRTDYLDSLRRLSRRNDPSIYPKMLARAHEFSSLLRYESLEELTRTLTACNAFDDTERRSSSSPAPSYLATPPRSSAAERADERARRPPRAARACRAAPDRPSISRDMYL